MQIERFQIPCIAEEVIKNEYIATEVAAGPSEQLVQNVDENKVTMTTAPPTPFGDRLPPNNPYPDDTPEPMLRTYTIRNSTWTNINPPYLVLTNFNPFYELWQKLIPVFNTKKWLYFSCKGVHLKLTISSTTYSAGLLQFRSIPAYCKGFQRETAPYWFQCHGMLVDPSRATVFEMTVPFMTPTNLVKQADDWAGLGEAILFVNTQLVDDAHDTDVANIDWRIEARFIEPKLTGQCTDTTLPTNSFQPIGSLDPPSFINLAQGPPSIKKEADKKSETGLISGIAETVGTVAHVLTPIPLVGEVAAGVGIIADAVGAVAKWFGFSKPVSQRALQPVSQYMSLGDTHCKGLTNSVFVACEPDAFVATDPALVRTDNDDASFDHMKALPNLIAIGTIPANATVQSQVFSIPVNPLKAFVHPNNKLQFSHLLYLSSLFRYWRGTLNFQLYLPMSKMRKMRFALCWTPSPMTVYNEDIRRIEFTTSESTTVDLAIPWCQVSRYLGSTIPRNNNTTWGCGTNGYISLWVLDRMTIAGKGAPVAQDWYLYMSGGEDFQVAGSAPITSSTTGLAPLVAPTLLRQKSEIPYAQGALSGAKGLKIQGIVAEDDLKSFREIAHRASHMQVFPINTPFYLYPLETTQNCLPNWIIRKFLFWRGSRNYHMYSTGDVEIKRYVTWSGGLQQAPGSTDAGFHYISGTSKWNVWSVPYLNDEDCLLNSDYLQVSHATAIPDVGYLCTNTGSSTSTFTSMGDDLSLGFVLPSPLYFYP